MPGIRCAWLSALCLAAFATFARAQEVQGATEAINSTTPTSTQDEITIHTILVSNKTHYFTPNSINALPGDIVTFKFWPGNHSVIRAEYGYPCIPYEDLDENESGGFYSGVQSPDEHDVESGNLPTWNLTINTTDPTFFYCGAPGSCVRWGMLGAINADAEHPIATQLKLAREAAYALTPGQPLPADVKTSMQNFAETATATATSSESTSSSTATAAASDATGTSSSNDSGSSGLSTGSIVGIAIGGAALLALAGGLFYFFGRSKTLSEQLRHSRTPAAGNTGNPGNAPNVDPNYGFGGMDSRHTSVLPPYAQVTPHYATEGKPPSLTEADGNMIGGYGHIPTPAMSPEMRHSDTFTGLSYQDGRPSVQNMQMRYSHTSDISRQASPPPQSPPPQPVHEMPTETDTSPRDGTGRGPFREMI